MIAGAGGGRGKGGGGEGVHILFYNVLSLMAKSNSVKGPPGLIRGLHQKVIYFIL